MALVQERQVKQKSPNPCYVMGLCKRKKRSKSESKQGDSEHPPGLVLAAAGLCASTWGSEQRCRTAGGCTPAVGVSETLGMLPTHNLQCETHGSSVSPPQHPPFSLFHQI